MLQDASLLTLSPPRGKHMNTPRSSAQKSVNGPCEAFLSIGSVFSSFVINRPGGEGQCKERLSRHRQISTCHSSPGLQRSCLVLPSASLLLQLWSQKQGAKQVHANTNCPHCHRNNKMSSSHCPFYPEPSHLKCSETPARNPSQRSWWHFSAEGILVSRRPWQAAHCGRREKVS